MTTMRSIPRKMTFRLNYPYNKWIHQAALSTKRYSTRPNNSIPKVFDIVCIGGGPAGLSLLSALRSSPATANLNIALIERQNLNSIRSFSLPPTEFSSRCSSLTPSSVRFLDEIGAWKYIQVERVQAYHDMQVWDGVSGARIEFSEGLNGTQNKIAHMTENMNLTSALLKRITELGGIEIYDSQPMVDIQLGVDTEDIDLRGWPVAHLGDGTKLAARLLVGADGANSPVRAFAGIGSSGWDYDREGVVATLKLEESEWSSNKLKTAYQRFLPTGPVAMLPLPGNYSTLVWSTTPERATYLKKLNLENFVAMVNAAFRLTPVDLAYMHTIKSNHVEELEWRLPHTNYDLLRTPQRVQGVQVGSINSFPLKLRHADTYIGDRVALVGDAAHTTHPLAGQGLNQGQADVESLMKAITYAVTHGQDIGNVMALEPYNSDRYAANHLLLGVVDKLHKLYSVQSGPLIPLRSIGLEAVNFLGPIKQFFMRRAAGS